MVLQDVTLHAMQSAVGKFSEVIHDFHCTGVSAMDVVCNAIVIFVNLMDMVINH